MEAARGARDARADGGNRRGAARMQSIHTCEGCGRTYDDLSNWMYLDKDGKREVIKRCKENLKKLAKI